MVAISSNSLCNLCKRNPADQTGSHIFSWFLIRDAINKIGAKRRDNEIVFSLSETDFVNTYFGKDQSNPIAVERIKGRELTDDEIEKMKVSNPFTKNNILCRNCEKRLQVIETLVSESAFSVLRKHTVKGILGYDTIEVDSEIIRLFIYSLLWRGAVVKQNDFEMLASHQEELRNILDDCLNIDREQLIGNANSESKRIKIIPLIVSYLETKGTNDNFIYCSLNYKPYAMILNDFSFQLFFPNASNNGFDIKLCGLNDIISKRALMNKDENKLKVGVLSNTKRLFVNRNIALLIARKMFENAEQYFIAGFARLFGSLPPKRVILAYRQRIVIDTADVVEKFTPAHFCDAAVEITTMYLQGKV